MSNGFIKGACQAEAAVPQSPEEPELLFNSTTGQGSFYSCTSVHAGAGMRHKRSCLSSAESCAGGNGARGAQTRRCALPARPHRQPFPQFPHSRATTRYLHITTTGRHEVTATNGDCKTHRRLLERGPRRERATARLRHSGRQSRGAGPGSSASPAAQSSAQRGKNAASPLVQRDGRILLYQQVSSPLSARKPRSHACLPLDISQRGREKQFTATYLLSASRCC